MKSMSRDGLAVKGLFQISDENTFSSTVLDCKTGKIAHNVRFGVKG